MTKKLDDLIAHARTDEPTPAELASLTRRLGPLLGPGGGGAPGGGSGDGGAPGGGSGDGGAPGGGSGGGVAPGGAAGGGAAGKVALAIGGLGTVAAIVGIALSRTPAPVRDAAVAVVAIDASLPADAAIPAPDAASPSASLAPDAAPDVAPAPRRPDPPRATDSLAAESAMLDRAQQALAASDARRALGICEDHAHRFSRGVLREERERIAIEALVALGRRREAKARVAAFDRAFPGSVQSERVHALVSP